MPFENRNQGNVNNVGQQTFVDTFAVMPETYRKSLLKQVKSGFLLKTDTYLPQDTSTVHVARCTMRVSASVLVIYTFRTTCELVSIPEDFAPALTARCKNTLVLYKTLPE